MITVLWRSFSKVNQHLAHISFNCWTYRHPLASVCPRYISSGSMMADISNLPIGDGSTEESTNEDGVTEVKEGKAVVRCDPKLKIFYNPTQEVNRDISILGIQTHIDREKKSDVNILEAMAASGIRSIRYALEISGINKVIANDYSKDAIMSINKNSRQNLTEDIVQPSFNDACEMMRSEKQKGVPGFVIDLDPYGSPAAFIDAAVQTVQEGGMLLVTATDMAVLAGGNAAETCYAKYGAMPLKTKACQEMALRIIIHAVQSCANRYGRVAIPLLSLKIDFYVRLFFKIIKSPERAKESAIKTSLVYHCTGCKTFTFQQMAVKKGEKYYGFSHGPPVPEKCANCNSTHHLGGPIWTGPIHDQEFVGLMIKNLEDKFEYLNTFPRIRGLLHLVSEEPDAPLYYDVSELCSVLKVSTPPNITIRSAILNLGYEVALSHAAPNTIKTNAPNKAIWDILRKWRLQSNCNDLKEGTLGHRIMQEAISTEGISFELHPDVKIPTKGDFVRYQTNPTKFWGPGVRNAVKGQAKAEDKRALNQGKKGSRISRKRYKNKNKNEGSGNESEQSEGSSPETKALKMDSS